MFHCFIKNIEAVHHCSHILVFILSHAAPTNLHLCPTSLSPCSSIDMFLAFSLMGTTISGIQNFLSPNFKLDKPLSVTEEILITLICDALSIFLGDNGFICRIVQLPTILVSLSKLGEKGTLCLRKICTSCGTAISLLHPQSLIC